MPLTKTVTLTIRVNEPLLFEAHLHCANAEAMLLFDGFSGMQGAVHIESSLSFGVNVPLISNYFIALVSQ